MNTQSLVYVVCSLKRLFIKETHRRMYVSPIEQAAEQFRNSLSQDILWDLNGRFERGVALATQGAVSPHSEPYMPDRVRLFKVTSSNQSRPPFHYIVDLDAGTCECPDHWKGHFCKHRIASHIIEIANRNRQEVMPSAPPSAPITLSSLGKQAQPTYQAPAAVSAPVAEAALRPSEPGPETLPSPSNNGVIWGVIKHQGQLLGVEVLALDGDSATIRALPKIIDGKKLQPQFPFDGKRATTTIPKKQLFHVKIFQ